MGVKFLFQGKAKRWRERGREKKREVEGGMVVREREKQRALNVAFDANSIS